MAVLKNRTQGNFTMISNNVLRDKELSMKDRGVLCTLCSLPDGWVFSVAGLSTLVPDGVDSIRKSIQNLEKFGYVLRKQSRAKNGKFISEIEVFTERDDSVDSDREGFTITAEPSRSNQHGFTVTVNPTEYNKDKEKKKYKNDNSISINLSEENEMDGEIEVNNYKKIIADNIKLDWLYNIAKEHGSSEEAMVTEIYDVICDMVCYPRNRVVIKDTSYPWETVKSRFLKLKYEHIAEILNRIVDADLGIKNMTSYLISVLYNASLVGTLEIEANLHDDYLKYLRGNPYR
ncbi:DUF6017 domain-containing protein [Frisingicoccus sp.]